MNAILEQINSVGLKFVEFALPMFVQSVVLIVILLLADFALRKKVRAVFRYWIWLLVLVKLVLPTSLSSSMSLGYFFGNRLTYVDRGETPIEPQAKLVEPMPVNVTPFIDLTNIEADRFNQAAPPIIPETKTAVKSPADTPAIPVTPLSWQGAVFLAWLTVVMAMILLLLQRAIFVRGLVAQAKEANGIMADMLESCSSSMSVKRKLGLKISANATSPAVCGLFKPVILVPQNLASSLPAGQLRAVLLHELAHIRRGDLFVNLAQTVLQIVYFYNPLLWLANCIIRRIREQAVDETVLVAMGEKAPQYPQTLVSVAKLAFNRPALSLRLIGVVESKSALSTRIKHILNRPMPKKAKLGIIGLAVVIIIGAILLPMANSMSGPPGLVIKGVVKDAQTSEPIAGARVFDDGYGPEPKWEQIGPDQRCQWGAITNSAGQYSFLTWPEHHTIKVQSPGYKAERRNLYSGHFVFSRKDQEIFDFTLEPEKITGSSEFKTTLPNGVMVELIGICEHPSQGKQWWRPDGDILASDQIPSDYSRMTVKPDETEMARELALRFYGSDVEHMSFRWNIDKATRSSSHPIYVTEKREKLKPQRNIVFKLPRNIETLDFNIGVAVGEWKRVASGGDGRTMSGTNDSLMDSSVIFHEAIKVKDKVRLSATHLLGDAYDCRIMVVDKDDKHHEPARSSNSGGDMRLCTCIFDLSPDQIKYILLQARPYQMVTFKNVSLKPNFKTNVQIDVKVEPVGSEVPAAMVGTWFFENPGGDDEQMSVFPDGRVVGLYSNGHRDESRYTDGSIELAEHKNAICKMTLEADGTLVQSFDSGGSLLIGKRWKRIDLQPSNNLLRVLTGPNSGKEAVDSGKLSGRVVDETGEPIVDAQVALSTEKIGVKISNGKLLLMRRGDIDSKIIQTDSQGRFNFGQKPSDIFNLIVAHEKGFAQVSSEDITAPYEIRIQPWGRIKGQLAQGRKAAGDKIALSSLPNSTWFVRRSECRYETKCDTAGSFVFDKVPPGWFEVGYLVSVGEASASITCRTPVEVEAGRAAELILGASGRPIVGKFVTPPDYDMPIYFGNGLRALDTVRPERPRPDNYDQMTKRQQQQWYRQWRKTDEYKKYRDVVWLDKNRRQYTFKINKDGSFRIEDVIAGEYDLTVWIEERLTGQGRPEEIAGYDGTIEVPDIPGGRSDEPLDLGELELTMHNPLPVGDIAPLFEAKTLNGENLRLFDYRGKFVLLSFWQPVFHPELQQLKELYDTYSTKGRFEIIGLGGRDTLEEVKNYVRENTIPWPQIYTGEEFKSGIAKDYGGYGIFLIDPNGRIVAKNLRDEKLMSTVIETLNAANQNKADLPVSD